MGLADINIDGGLIKGALEGVGGLFKDIRTAITGIDAEKQATLLEKMQQIEGEIEKARISVMVAEASSQDKWTSRARPAFLYVMYIMVLAAIPMGVIYAINPVFAGNITAGVQAWLKAIPESMWALMGAGYLGYVGARSYDKKQGTSN